MDPVEAISAREFPDYNPFPFGALNWAQQVSRSILLAEPMVGDFEACFKAIDSDETVIALAESFAFRSCVRRQPLADVVASRT